MSPRRSNPNLRPTLIDVAARLLAEEGAQSLTTRRVAAETGTSTMAVYTHFGGMSELVKEMVYEGFARMQRYFASIDTTDDPVADLALIGRAYRHNARVNRHLYGVMFGGASLAGFSVTEQDRQHGRYTLVDVIGASQRCVKEQRFRDEDPALVAHQMWIGVHGAVSLELGGYLIDPCDADRCFEAQLLSLMIGAGDAPEMAASSIADSTRRAATGFGELGPR